MGAFSDVFISYGRADSKAFTLELNRQLIEQNLSVWVDFDGIPFGVDYQKQIADGIDKADNFLFIISPHSVNSPHCRKEIELAVQRNKRIVPLLHVSEISRETWQKRNPKGTDTDWATYQAKGLGFGDERNPNMHPIIARINWIGIREGVDDYDIAFKGLLELLNRHKDYVRNHTYILDRALEWEQHRKQTRYLLIGEERRAAEEWLRIRFKAEQPPCIPTDLHCEYITESTKNANNLMSQVFLSHAEDDVELATQVRRSLLREGLTVWTNRNDIATGHDFEAALKQGIEQADNVVYLLSSASLQSDLCQIEIQYATSLNKRTIPLLISHVDTDKIPHQLRNVQLINLINHEQESSYLQSENQLLKILHDDAPYYETHKILLVKALKWQQQSHNSSILLRGYNLRHAEAWLKMGQMRSLHPPLPLQETFIQKSLEQPPDAAVEVFISYSRIDSDFARRLNDQLQIQGKTTWFDQESIAAGVDFQQEIYRGIETSDNFLFIISPASVNSPYCADEVEYAAKLNKRFVTVLHRTVDAKTLHPDLAKIQWIDFNRHNGDFYANFSELIRTLDTDREYVHSHTRWSLRSLEWHEKDQSRKDQSKDLLLQGSEVSIATQWLEEAKNTRKQPPPTELQKKFIIASQDLLNTKQKQEKRQTIVLATLLCLMTVAFAAAVRQYLAAERQREQAEVAQESQIRALSRYAVELEDNHQDLRSLVEGIRSADLLEQQRSRINKVDADIQALVTKALQNALYEISQSNSVNGHQQAINSVSVSPNSSMFVTASADGTVKFWSIDGQELHALEPHTTAVTDVAFSPDGRTVATASDDGNVRLWNEQGNLRETLPRHKSKVLSVSFSHDGKTIASSSADGTVRLWNENGQNIGMLPGQGAVISDVSFSQDGQTIATARGDGMVSLWTRNGQLLREFKAHDEETKSVEFSPTDSLIATAGSDDKAKLWTLDSQSVHIAHILNGHTDSVGKVRFSVDGQRIITASDDNTVKLWTLEGQEVQTLRGHTDVVTDVAFNSQHQMIITVGSDKTIKLWSDQVSEFETLPEHDGIASSVRFSPDGKLMAIASDDGTVKLWDIARKERLQLKGRHSDRVTNVSFSPDSQLIATASYDKTVKLWNRAGELVETILGNEGIILTVDFSPDGKTLAIGGANGIVKLWNLNDKKISSLPGHQAPVWSLSFSPDGKMLATGSADSTVKVWSLLDGKESRTFEHAGEVYAVQFSPNGQTLVTGTTENLLRIWYLDGRSPISLSHSQTINAISFSPDGSIIAAGDFAGYIRLWSQDGKPLKTLKGHRGAIFSLSFSADGQTLASTSEDYSVRLWHINKSQLEQTAQLWKLDLNGLVAKGCEWVQNYLTHSNEVDEGDRKLCQKF
jgi:WD40 repeat protein